MTIPDINQDINANITTTIEDAKASGSLSDEIKGLLKKAIDDNLIKNVTVTNIARLAKKKTLTLEQVKIALSKCKTQNNPSAWLYAALRDDYSIDTPIQDKKSTGSTKNETVRGS